MPGFDFAEIKELFQFARTESPIRIFYHLVHGAIHRLGLRRFVRLAALEVFSADVPSLAKHSRVPGAFALRFAGTADVPAIASFQGKLQRIPVRLSGGNLCWSLWSGSTLQAVEWIAPGPREYWEEWDEIRCVLRIAAGSCWLFDGLGSGRGSWGIAMRALPRELESMGIRTIYAQVDYGNPISLKSHRSAGYCRIGTIVHLGLGRLSCTRFKGSNGKWQSLPVTLAGLEFAVPSREAVRRQFELFPMYRNS